MKTGLTEWLIRKLHKNPSFWSTANLSNHLEDSGNPSWIDSWATAEYTFKNIIPPSRFLIWYTHAHLVTLILYNGLHKTSKIQPTETTQLFSLCELTALQHFCPFLSKRGKKRSLVNPQIILQHSNVIPDEQSIRNRDDRKSENKETGLGGLQSVPISRTANLMDPQNSSKCSSQRGEGDAWERRPERGLSGSHPPESSDYTKTTILQIFCRFHDIQAIVSVLLPM